MAVPEPKPTKSFIDEDIPPKKETTFFDGVATVAYAAQDLIRSLRLTSSIPDRALEELILPDALQDETITVEMMAGILRDYFAQGDLNKQLHITPRPASRDGVAQYASTWSGDVATWEREAYTPARRHIDELMKAFEWEAAQKVQELEDYLNRTSSRIHTLVREAYGDSQNEAGAVHFSGVLAGRIAELHKELYVAATLKHRDNPELLYTLSFKAVLNARGWDKLRDGELAGKLAEAHVPLFVFEKWAGRKVRIPKKEKTKDLTATIQEVDNAVKRGISSEVYIEELPDRYVLSPVPLGDGVWEFGWSKELLDSSNSHMQDDWIALTRDGEFKLASGPQYEASILALYDARARGDEEQKALIERVAQMFRDDFDPGKPYMMTSTRITYRPAAPDSIVHGYPNGEEIRANIIGPGGYFSPGQKEALEALLGTRDTKKLTAAGKWLTGKKSYLWRFNARPTQDAVRVLALGCCDYYFNCNAYSYYLNDSRPARGVVTRRLG